MSFIRWSRETKLDLVFTAYKERSTVNSACPQIITIIVKDLNTFVLKGMAAADIKTPLTFPVLVRQQAVYNQITNKLLRICFISFGSV